MDGSDRSARLGTVSAPDADLVPDPVPYPRDRVVDIVLRDGSTVRVRPVRTDDAPAIRAFLDGISSESIVFRFFGAPNLDWVTSWSVDVDYEDRYALVAETGEPPHVIAHAAYARESADRAEVAFLVSDSHQGHGISTILLAHLAGVAETHGITTFTAEVMPANHRMIEVFRQSGFPVEMHSTHDAIRLELPTSLTPGGGRALRGAGAARDRRGRAQRPRAALGRRDRRLAPARNDRRRDPPQPARRRVQRSGVRRQRERRRRAVAARLPLDRRRARRSRPGRDRRSRRPGGRRRPRMRRRGRAGARRDLLGLRRGRGRRRRPPARARRGLPLQPASASSGRTASASSTRRRRSGSTRPSRRTRRDRARSGSCRSRAASGSRSIEAAGRLGIGFSQFVSVGNKADLSGNDLLTYWEQDPNDGGRAALPRIVRQPPQVRPDRPAIRSPQAASGGQERPLGCRREWHLHRTRARCCRPQT